MPNSPASLAKGVGAEGVWLAGSPPAAAARSAEPPRQGLEAAVLGAGRGFGSALSLAWSMKSCLLRTRAWKPARAERVGKRHAQKEPSAGA